jgi:hypothetical protein
MRQVEWKNVISWSTGRMSENSPVSNPPGTARTWKLGCSFFHSIGGLDAPTRGRHAAACLKTVSATLMSWSRVWLGLKWPAAKRYRHNKFRNQPRIEKLHAGLCSFKRTILNICSRPAVGCWEATWTLIRTRGSFWSPPDIQTSIIPSFMNISGEGFWLYN